MLIKPDELLKFWQKSTEKIFSHSSSCVAQLLQLENADERAKQSFLYICYRGYSFDVFVLFFVNLLQDLLVNEQFPYYLHKLLDLCLVPLEKLVTSVETERPECTWAVCIQVLLDSVFLPPLDIHIQDKRPSLALIIISAIAVNLHVKGLHSLN